MLVLQSLRCTLSAALGFLPLVIGASEASGSPAALQNILKNTHQSSLYEYPTDLTRGIIPIPVHSHNDYWRDIPFFSALAAGCMSVEADVWLYDDVLYVGHDQSSLTEHRTFESLYVDPILDVLKRQNPTNDFLSERTRNGVYDADPSQTLYLFVDLKTEGPKTWPRVIDALRPLRDADYLAKVKDGKTFVPGPVTVIGTGNTPLDLVAPVSDRDYFFDAPLEKLGWKEFKNVTSLVSPIASTSLIDSVGGIHADGESPLSDKQLEIVRKQLVVAKKRDIGGRYWDTPGWPVRKRNEIWRTLLREDVALLNADDMDAIGEYF